MNEIIIQVRYLEQNDFEKIWIDIDYKLLDWIQEMYPQAIMKEVYLLEENRFLNPQQTVYENQVCHMDHCIVI